MKKLMILAMTLLISAVAFAGDGPDGCQDAKLAKDGDLYMATRMGMARDLTCWHQADKVLSAGSILQDMVDRQQAEFQSGAVYLNLQIAALAGFRLDSVVLFKDRGGLEHVELILVNGDKTVTRTYRITSGHFLN